jgi:hypothetical protein
MPADEHDHDHAREHEHQHVGCPFCGLFAAMNTAQPEAMEHLLNAAHELVQAARVALDAADQVIEQQRHARASAREPRLRRIDIS